MWISSSLSYAQTSSGLLSLRVKAKLKFSWCTVLTGHPHVSAHTHTYTVASYSARRIPATFAVPWTHQTCLFLSHGFFNCCSLCLGDSWWLSGKQSTCQCRKGRRCGSIPGSERFPGRQNGNPAQWEIPQIEEPGRVQSTECQRVGHVWALEAPPIEAHIASSLMFSSLFSGVITFQCDFPWPPYLKLKTLQPRHISYLSFLFFFPP